MYKIKFPQQKSYILPNINISINIYNKQFIYYLADNSLNFYTIFQFQ